VTENTESKYLVIVLENINPRRSVRNTKREVLAAVPARHPNRAHLCRSKFIQEK
jgi:hypothetical protein